MEEGEKHYIFACGVQPYFIGAIWAVEPWTTLAVFLREWFHGMFSFELCNLFKVITPLNGTF